MNLLESDTVSVDIGSYRPVIALTDDHATQMPEPDTETDWMNGIDEDERSGDAIDRIYDKITAFFKNTTPPLMVPQSFSTRVPYMDTITIAEALTETWQTAYDEVRRIIWEEDMADSLSQDEISVDSYVDNLLRQVQSETVDGKVYMYIPETPGVWAYGDDIPTTLRALEKTLIDWLILQLKDRASNGD